MVCSETRKEGVRVSDFYHFNRLCQLTSVLTTGGIYEATLLRHHIMSEIDRDVIKQCQW